MPRRPRRDKPGRLHHVINRGQDGRRIFKYRSDYRFFLSLLVRAVRAGRIQLHAYCLMPNHYHLLVESVDGNLSATMQWVQFRYAAFFNRTRNHKGHVFGGRFRSFPVTTRVYLFVLIRYIDRNPWNLKDPRKRKDPIRFPWCSAHHHAKPGPRPRWLDRRIIDRFLHSRLERGEEREHAYRAVFRITQPDPAGDSLVELRMAGRSRERDDLDTLLAATQADIALWLRARAEEDADGTVPLAVVDPGSVLQAVAALRRQAAPFRLETGRGPTRDPRPLVEIGLLRDLVGLTYDAAGKLVGVAASRLRTRYALHRAALVEGERYLDLVAHTAHAALARAFGEDVRDVARGTADPASSGEDASHPA